VSSVSGVSLLAGMLAMVEEALGFSVANSFPSDLPALPDASNGHFEKKTRKPDSK
jgi:hypothetical protein